MNYSERIIDFIRGFPGMDDDQISASLQIVPRQTVNQACRVLAKRGVIERRPNLTGKLGNYPVDNVGGKPIVPAFSARAPFGENSTDVTKEWFWEGNVSDAVARYFAEQGWNIISQADTRTKERGLDLHALRGGQEVMVEVKGYPSQSYRDQNRSHQQKPTNPALQAQHWYSHAVLKAMRLWSANPSAMVAVAFPDFPRYRTLFKETERAFRQLGVGILFVSAGGQVDVIGL